MTALRTLNITAIHLLAEGGETNTHAVVRVEIDGRWHEAIREHIDGPFSHIIERGGLEELAGADEPDRVRLLGNIADHWMQCSNDFRGEIAEQEPGLFGALQALTAAFPETK